MKKVLLFLTALLCVTSLYAQTDPLYEKYVEKPLPNEFFFTQSDLVFEGQFLRMRHSYNFKGTLNYEDTYEIRTYKVLRVYKGDQSLTGDTVYVVKKGGYLGQERSFDDDITISVQSYTPPLLYENGIDMGINFYTPAIYFLVHSDLTDDLDSKFAIYPKYKELKRYSGETTPAYTKMYVCGDKILGLDNLVFHTREDFYNYIKQFDGFTIPETPKEPEHLEQPEQEWRNDAVDVTLYPEQYEYMKAVHDLIQKEIDKEKQKNSKKKAKENAKSGMEDKTLTLFRNKPVKVKEGSKWYVKFDVLVSSNDPNTYLASTYMPVTYDKTIFGTLPLNKITVTIDNNFNVAEMPISLI